MAVVAVYAPRLQHPICVALMARSSHVVDHTVLRASLEGGTDLGGNLVKCLIPGNLFPFTCTAWALASHRVENSLRVLNLVNRRWTLGAVASTAARMLRVALELCDLAGFLVDIRQ